MRKKVSKDKDTPLSGNQIMEMMRDMNDRVNLVVDSDIKPTDNIEKIFKDRGHCVMFHRWPAQEIGHWVCAIRTPEYMYYFDSFGRPPYNDAIVDVATKQYGELLYNDNEFQPRESNACARYCLLAIALHKLGLNPLQIEKFMDSIDVDAFVIDNIR